MDQRTLDNWKKVKEALEQSGRTKGDIYKRAVAIVKSGVDPGMPKMFD
jgi:adenine C2-methylase RlmN of 23S rRNA A2503 and tRNA A37